MKIFRATTEDGDIILTADLIDVLADMPDVTLDDCETVCAVHEGSKAQDAEAATRIYGDPFITGPSQMQQRFKGGKNDVDYVITFKPILSDGEIDPVQVMQPVRKYL